MKQINFEKNKFIKESTKNINTNLFEHTNQISIINQLYLNHSIDNKSIFINELESKINNYKQQDKGKSIELNNLITIYELIEKLVSSKLKCFYCKHYIFILYKYKHEEYQWSLDRIDNKLGHSCDNTLISCLKCNLERRCKQYQAFKFTKQLNIKKI